MTCDRGLPFLSGMVSVATGKVFRCYRKGLPFLSGMVSVAQERVTVTCVAIVQECL